jgi:hypothetical protein
VDYELDLKTLWLDSLRGRIISNTSLITARTLPFDRLRFQRVGPATLGELQKIASKN